MNLKALTLLGLAAAVAASGQDKPAAPSGEGFEGNWVVTYGDYPEKGKTSKAFITIARTWTVPPDPAFDKGVAVGQSRPPRKWVPQRDPTSPLVHSAIGLPRGDLNLSEEGTLRIKYPYHHLGNSGGVSEVSITGANSASGRWSYNDGGGSESWTRAQPSIREIEFVSDITDKVPLGEVGRMKTSYSADDWAAGNRSVFMIYVRGDDLWGHHVAWMDAEGIAVWGAESRPISSDPNAAHLLEIHGAFWSAASPGRKILHVDGFKIPFDLEVTGFPEERKPPVPELRFVRLNGDKYEPVAQLRHGQQFCVEALYRKKPPTAPGKVELNWTQGSPIEVEVRPTDDEKVFRSEPIRLEPSAD
jgi:hypothetical protein